MQSALGDLFSLQDDFTRRIVESLSIPLSQREKRLMGHDVPATARAYEYYLRANECARQRAKWPVAHDLYKQCVEEDPRYAPGWARLGRMERLVGIYFDAERADEHLRESERAFQRALELNPDLPVAHNFYAYLEVDFGRAAEAMRRLLDCARSQRADPELYAGLVHVCRYCGLLNASIAAYEKAHRLDPNIQTSVCHSFWFVGDAARAIATDNGEIPFMKYLLQIRGGEREQVLEALRQLAVGDGTMYASGWERLVAALTGDHDTFARGLEAEVELMRDPEGIYYWALMAALIGDADRAFDLLQRTVDRGWMCHQALTREPVLDSIRADPRMAQIVGEMERRHDAAVAVFVDAGGERLLGPQV